MSNLKSAERPQQSRPVFSNSNIIPNVLILLYHCDFWGDSLTLIPETSGYPIKYISPPKKYNQ